MSNKPIWMDVAEKELGVAEVPGDQDNPRIVEYHQATTLKATDDETAWCSAFVNWCMQQAKVLGTGSAAARSWLTWGKKLDIPEYGCICIFSRGTNPAQGHVGFYVGTDGWSHVKVLGGNQGNKVSVQSYPLSRLLGYRWPPQ